MKQMTVKDSEPGLAVTNVIHALPSMRLCVVRTIVDHEVERTELEVSGESGLDARRGMAWLLAQIPRARGNRL